MKKETILVGIVGLLIGGIFGYAIGEVGGKSYGPGMMHGEMMHGEQYEEYDGRDPGMMMGEGPMMDHSMMMVLSEREFIEGMIPHHQEAVDTAKEVIARGGTTPAIQELVSNIVVAQEAEIAEMKEWYQEWYGEEYQDTGDYQPMMRELEGLTGADIDRVFLEDMIMHHMGAIMMARSVRPYIEHQEIETLADAIEETQSEEIALMRQLLEELE